MPGYCGKKMKKALRLPESAVFNLSHSGKYVLCACSDREDVQTGCDDGDEGKCADAGGRTVFLPGRM